MVVVPEETAWIVIRPEPTWSTVIWVPIGKATEAFVGTLKVAAVEELEARRIFPASEATRV
jgi:hypothetical protein